LGVLIYEFVVGVPPFESNEAIRTQCKIKKGEFNLPNYLSEDVKDLIQGLVKLKPEERMTLDQVKNHRWVVKYKDYVGRYYE